jgi:hypothetical protein
MSEPEQKQPSPGSDEAVAKGCKCPILDNAHGTGYMQMANIYIINEECPLHGIPGVRGEQTVLAP